MSMGLIGKCLDELAALKYHGRIEWYIYSEPTRDRRLPEILKLARRLCPRACLMISTNGDYFRSTADIEKLYNAGLNQAQINVYSHEHRYQQLLEIVNTLELDQESSVYQYASPHARICKVVAKYFITVNTQIASYLAPTTSPTGAGTSRRSARRCSCPCVRIAPGRSGHGSRYSRAEHRPCS